jgi:tetratricopeptide (TPR) repeat protein
MIAFDVGNTEKASRIAAQAQVALNEGDTARARSLFRQAAEDLERKISGARKRSEKDMLRFLAASQYYHGGLYTEAQRLCRRIQTNVLPSDVRPIFQKFLLDVNNRADTGYRDRIRGSLLRHVQRNEPQGILELLQVHPYVLNPADLAFMRASACEQLKDYKAAALFSADVIRYAPEAPELLFQTLALPIVFAHEGKLCDAWEYVSYQLQAIPHALTSINASLVRGHQARLSAANEERIAWTREQIRFFENAWERFQLLPRKIQEHSTIREYMVLGFEAAAFGYLRLNQPEKARELCKRIVDLFPNMPDSTTLRSILDSSSSQTSEEAMRDSFSARELAISSNFGQKRQETVEEIFSNAA